MLKRNDILQITKNIQTVSVGIIGDFCIDIYWHADMTKSELSRETPNYPLPVTEEKIYLGAGGNVASNIAALRPADIYACTLTGSDWRGSLMLGTAEKLGISTEYFINTPGRFTPAYCKPMKHGISALVQEDARIDFDNFTPVSAEAEDKIISSLRDMLKKIDILCVADQFRFGIITPRVREEIISAARSGLQVIADSRYNISCYTDCILKPNEVECWRAVYNNDGYMSADENGLLQAARLLAVKNKARVFCTLGERGSFVTDGTAGRRIPAVELSGELDICGAGDTSLSAFTCALASGCGIEKAAEFAGLASAVTIKKIGITGTAAPEEIAAAAEK